MHAPHDLGAGAQVNFVLDQDIRAIEQRHAAENAIGAGSVSARQIDHRVRLLGGFVEGDDGGVGGGVLVVALEAEGVVAGGAGAVVGEALGAGVAGETVAVGAKIAGPALAEGVEDEGAEIEVAVMGFGGAAFDGDVGGEGIVPGAAECRDLGAAEERGGRHAAKCGIGAG